MPLNLDAMKPRGNVAYDYEPPVVVEPPDPYPYLYAYYEDSNSIHMAVGTIAGEEPEPPAVATIASVEPNAIMVDEQTLITVTGTGYAYDDVVYQDEVGMTTTFVSETELTFIALASSEGVVDVTVHGAGGVSNSMQLTVTAPVEEEPPA